VALRVVLALVLVVVVLAVMGLAVAAAAVVDTQAVSRGIAGVKKP
jgi:hypothetical protein